jgi:hypothetical protein
MRRGFVATVANAINARAKTADVDDDQKDRRQRVDAEMRANPR